MNSLISNRAVFLVVLFLLPTLLLAAPVSADPGMLYVDAAGICGGNTPCYLHPQDAVNAANPGDIINVYPGTYGQRRYTFPKGPFWGDGDQYAPALIVWKNGLTIQATDPDPQNTVIKTDYNFWVNKGGDAGGGGSIQASTGGTFVCTARTSSSYPSVPWRCKNDCTLGADCPWTCRDSNDNVIDQAPLAGKYVCSAGYWEGDCVRPNSGTAPNAVAVTASNVVISGFTFQRHFDYTSGTYNTAGVMIGGLYAGDPDHLGSDGNSVENSVFSDVWHAVYIWHSSGNVITNNNVAALNTNHWAAISTYDGYNDAQINLGHPSENNIISHNTLANKGIALGAWAPPTWTSNAGSKVTCNTATQVGVTYSNGPVIVACNTSPSGGPAGFWQSNTDKVLHVTDVTYTGDTSLWGHGPVSVTLSAALQYDGTADGSGVEVVFKVNDQQYSAITVAGGIATTTITLTPGNYVVDTKVSICPCCEFTDSDPLAIGCSLTIGYWKNHATATAKLLPVWLGTADGAKSVQVTTAAQALQYLNMKGSNNKLDASNGINKLYAQLLAAKLDIKSGADGSAISTTISSADAFLATHDTGDWSKLSKLDKAQVLSWATTLANYNNGLIGPGYCMV